ncbi:putative protein PHOX1-4 [Helianthus debilis subsp. tardiflorus]
MLTGQRLPNSEPVQSSVSENVSSEKPEGVEECIVQFTRLFKNHVGLDTNPYLDLHEIGMELYFEAMEDGILKNAPNLFNIAGEKFKETSEYHQRVQRVCEFLFLVGCIYIFSTVSVITMGQGIVGKSVLVLRWQAYSLRRVCLRG